MVLSPRCLPALGSDPLLPVQLARYLNRNYWEKKQEEARKSPTPSAPVPLTEPTAQPGEGHAIPANVEVRGHSQSSDCGPLGEGHQDRQRWSLTVWSFPDFPRRDRPSGCNCSRSCL